MYGWLPRPRALHSSSYGQCFGPRLWLPQAQQLGWPIQLVAASLREEVVVKLPPRRNGGGRLGFFYVNPGFIFTMVI